MIHKIITFLDRYCGSDFKYILLIVALSGVVLLTFTVYLVYFCEGSVFP